MENECLHTHGLIPDFVAGELSGKESVRLAQHLKGCEVCAKVAERYREILVEASASEPEIEYDAVWQKISKGLDRQGGARPWLIGVLLDHKAWSLGAAACAILILLFFLARSSPVRPAMSVAEIEAILRNLGEAMEDPATAYQSHLDEDYRLLDNPEDERLYSLPGVDSADEEAGSSTPF
jgi:anti-sigma factor RsiW